MDDEGETSTLERLQGLGKRMLDESYVGKRIEYLSNFDMDEAGTIKEARWCAGEIEAVSDGTWVLGGHRSKTWKENEAARVFWDPVPEANMKACRSIEKFAENMWNKNVVAGAWKMEKEEVDYGLPGLP